MPATTGPDFICIGMQKAGTGWLFDQLQHHADFWMPPVKEIRYLIEERPSLGKAGNLLDLAESSPARLQKKLERGNRRTWDERDYAFLRQARACAKLPMDLDRYASLFAFKGELISGDITPGYSTLKADVISRIASHLPRVKIVLLIRDPVARVWSQISMAHRRENFDGGLLRNPQAFRTFLEGSTTIAERAYPARIAALWRRAAPQLNFRHFFLDQIEVEPEVARRDILTFLGGDPEKKSGDLLPEHNRKSSNKKLELTDDIRKILVDHFADEIRACADMFGDYASNWVARYNL